MTGAFILGLVCGLMLALAAMSCLYCYQTWRAGDRRALRDLQRQLSLLRAQQEDQYRLLLGRVENLQRRHEDAKLGHIPYSPEIRTLPVDPPVTLGAGTYAARVGSNWSRPLPEPPGPEVVEVPDKTNLTASMYRLNPDDDYEAPATSIFRSGAERRAALAERRIKPVVTGDPALPVRNLGRRKSDQTQVKVTFGE